eukprot:TRINITY_DN8140_c0_g1_i1.p1 TRINITY_DN8140_c0_g1~~TRINITY_DN8140_c0_g1_i1.p1  ORF type:complete len:175 (-),score=38.82 TRINITY_DN8140_c0_g1_i1:56-580(-)
MTTDDQQVTTSSMSWERLAFCVGIPLGGGWASGLATKQAINTWYKFLNKPSWNPPNWAFPVAWTSLYALMGISSYRVLQRLTSDRKLSTGDALQSPAFQSYGLSLALNFAWTPLFMVLHRTDLALIDIVALNASIAWTIIEWAKIDTLASKLMIPYWLWTAYASSLNYYIWKNN